jgi:tetratricopeptide (TPR) repeat protein
LHLSDQALRVREHAKSLDIEAVRPWCFVAMSLRDMKRYDEALAHLDRCRVLDPHFRPELLTRALTFSHVRRYDESLATYKQYLLVHPDEAGALNNHADVLVRMGRAEDALPQIERALALDPALYSAWFTKGEALFQLGRDDEALAAFQRGFELEPDAPGALASLSRVYAKLHHYAGAQRALDRALLLDPDEADAWAALGDLHAAQGRHADAVEAYERSLALDPDKVAVWHACAAALRALGRDDEAVAADQGAANKGTAIAARQNAPIPPLDPALLVPHPSDPPPPPVGPPAPSPVPWTSFIRRVLAHARDEAELLGDHHVGAEHLLLGLLAVPTCLAAEVLRRASVTLEAARAAVRQVPGRGLEGASRAPDDELGLGLSGRAALTGAAREADHLLASYVATQHLLLALAQLDDGPTQMALARLDLKPARLRADTLAAIRPA